MAAIAPSVDTRVLVDRLENIIAMVLPARDDARFCDTKPDFIALLCKAALRIKVFSSVLERSLIDKKWRGAKGEIWGVDGVEGDGVVAYARHCTRNGLRIVEVPERSDCMTRWSEADRREGTERQPEESPRTILKFDKKLTSRWPFEGLRPFNPCLIC